MKRLGSAVWQGDLKSGKGTVSSDSGVLTNQQYSFGTRFENGKGTNPEELIAAAHASCFTMALSAQLGNSGLTPENLETKATVTHILLDVKGRVPKADQAAWDKATQAAKTGCPISKLLNTTIEMNAKLEG